LAALDMLRSAADFQNMQSQSRSHAHRLLMLRYRRNGLDRTRYGISTGRRVGSAVVRNKVRRRLRTILRGLDPSVERGWDFLLVIRPEAADVTQAELAAALHDLMRRGDFLAATPGSPGQQSL
jgi:ribonuclease P protein component